MLLRIAGIAGPALLSAATAAPAPAETPAEMAAEMAGKRLTPPAPPIVALPRLTPAQAASPPLSPGVVWEHPPTVPAPLSPVGLPDPAPPPAARAAEPAPAPPPVPPAKPQPDSIPQPPVKEVARETAKPVPARRTMVATAGIYLRATPDAKGRVLDTVEKGDRVEAFGAPVNGWQRVGRAGRPQGYATSAYLAEAAPNRAGTAGPAAAPKAGRYAKAAPEDRGCALPGGLPERVHSPRLPAGTVARLRAAGNLRVAPVCDARVLDVLDAGERVTVLEAAGGWYRVGRKGKTLGYVGAALLAPTKR